jgi:hypothetical protein
LPDNLEENTFCLGLLGYYFTWNPPVLIFIQQKAKGILTNSSATNKAGTYYELRIVIYKNPVSCSKMGFRQDIKKN